MFVKMLTHMHMVVYTWWCWHICKGGGVPRVERGVSCSLPPAELARRDSALLRKLSAYFLLRRWEIWRSRGSVSRTGRWPLASGVLSGATECTGRTGESPVLCVRCAGDLATLSARESGEHRTLRVRPVTVRVRGALCARVRCAPDASGVD